MPLALAYPQKINFRITAKRRLEFTVYYRANAANNAGTDGQLVAPYLLKLVASYNF
jgi:hypothetical protein